MDERKDKLGFTPRTEVSKLDVAQFDYKPPTGDQPDRYKYLTEACKAFATVIDQMCPDSREKSLAITNLEQSRMWASSSIAKHG